MGGRVLRLVTRLNRGGPLRQVGALLPGLAARGWTGPLVTGRVERGEPDGGDDLERAGARLVRLGTLQRGLSPWRDLRALRDLLALARRERPDLVHTHLGKAGALGRLVARRLDVPCVHTFHGHHLDLPGWGPRLVGWAERRLAALTTRAIVLSERQRRDLVEVHRVLPAAAVRVVPPGLDLAAFRARAQAEPAEGARGAAGEDARRAEAALEGGRAVLWVGRFVPVKNPLALVEVAERLPAPLRLVALGEGPMRARVRRRAARRGLGERLLLPGALRHPAAWLARARALLFTSRAEGTPLAALEAFALGVPVVAPTVGGLPDVVHHGVNGLWAPPDDAPALAAALGRLEAEPALRARLAAGARASAEAYGADALAERTAAVYAEVLGGRSRAPGAPAAG